jgi:hypothetical protein
VIFARCFFGGGRDMRCYLVSIHKRHLLPRYVVLREFPAAAYEKYASPQTLVRPCLGAKSTVSESDTDACAHLSKRDLWMGTIYDFVGLSRRSQGVFPERSNKAHA